MACTCHGFVSNVCPCAALMRRAGKSGHYRSLVWCCLDLGWLSCCTCAGKAGEGDFKKRKQQVQLFLCTALCGGFGKAQGAGTFRREA